LLTARREIVLALIDAYYQVSAAAIKRIQQLEAEIERRQEALAKEAWTAKLLLDKLTELDSEAAHAIIVDRQVNELDPDFSFRVALNASKNDDLS
jgi:hypothetical protein